MNCPLDKFLSFYQLTGKTRQLIPLISHLDLDTKSDSTIIASKCQKRVFWKAMRLSTAISHLTSRLRADVSHCIEKIRASRLTHVTARAGAWHRAIQELVGPASSRMPRPLLQIPRDRVTFLQRQPGTKEDRPAARSSPSARPPPTQQAGLQPENDSNDAWSLFISIKNTLSTSNWQVRRYLNSSLARAPKLKKNGSRKDPVISEEA